MCQHIYTYIYIYVSIYIYIYIYIYTHIYIYIRVCANTHALRRIGGWAVAKRAAQSLRAFGSCLLLAWRAPWVSHNVAGLCGLHGRFWHYGHGYCVLSGRFGIAGVREICYVRQCSNANKRCPRFPLPASLIMA